MSSKRNREAIGQGPEACDNENNPTPTKRPCSEGAGTPGAVQVEDYECAICCMLLVREPKGKHLLLFPPHSRNPLLMSCSWVVQVDPVVGE